jgi:hypothetical protein
MLSDALSCLATLGLPLGDIPNTVEATSIASVHSGLYADHLIMVDGLRWLCRPAVIWGHTGSSRCWFLIGMGRNRVWKDDRKVLEVVEGAGDKRKGKNGRGCCCATM